MGRIPVPVWDVRGGLTDSLLSHFFGLGVPFGVLDFFYALAPLPAGSASSFVLFCCWGKVTFARPCQCGGGSAGGGGLSLPVNPHFARQLSTNWSQLGREGGKDRLPSCSNAWGCEQRWTLFG